MTLSLNVQTLKKNSFLSSEIAKKILTTWPAETVKFVKVFPYEYQKALKEIEARELEARQNPTKALTNGQTGMNGHAGHEPSIKDIEEAIQDLALDKKKLDKILDKTRYGSFCSILQCCSI